jgi:hypothetical protein
VASGKTVASGEAIASCTLIVTAANEFARHIHDRMPALLGHHDFELGQGDSKCSKKVSPEIPPARQRARQLAAAGCCRSK